MTTKSNKTDKQQDRFLPIFLAVISVLERYPFGMTLIGRNFNGMNEYRFEFTGHEKENEITGGIYSTETRLLDTRLGLWRGVDLLASKYLSESPYNYCLNNPIIIKDSDGKKAWVVIWATQSSDTAGETRIGHTGIIIENFEQRTSDDGTVSYVSKGTYTYYDLWPESANLSGKDATKDVNPVYNKQAFQINVDGTKATDYASLERYLKNHDISQVSGIIQGIAENSLAGYGEGYSPDGVVRMDIIPKETFNLQQKYESLITTNAKYNGKSNNCTSFVAEGLNKSKVTSIGKENIIDWKGILVNGSPWHRAFTPNNTYNQLKEKSNATIVKDAGSKTNESYGRCNY